MSRYIVGITGASGSIYAVRLLHELLKSGNEVHLIATQNGRKVLSYEMEYTFDTLVSALEKLEGSLKVHDVEDLFAPVASGSFKADGMVILPCSMATLGELAAGASKSLLGRAADVCMKERRKLVLVPREAPLSTLHLRNMLTLSELGVTIFPAMPSFYQKPRSIDDIVNSVVGRILDSLGIENDLYMKWGV